jgi:hypothetical protein
LGTADFTATSGTTVVLASGATAGDLVETVSFFVSSVLNAIPAVANAVTTSYINDGAVTKAKMAASGAWAPAGTVLQVVQGSWAAYQGTTSSTFSDVVGASVSITPKFSTSKILALVSVANAGKATNNTYLNLLLVRNSTTIASINGIAMTQTTLEQNVGVTMNYLDSPATTSSTTYKLQIASGNNNSQAWVNNYQSGAGTAPSTITLMEIAG